MHRIKVLPPEWARDTHAVARVHMFQNSKSPPVFPSLPTAYLYSVCNAYPRRQDATIHRRNKTLSIPNGQEVQSYAAQFLTLTFPWCGWASEDAFPSTPVRTSRKAAATIVAPSFKPHLPPIPALPSFPFIAPAAFLNDDDCRSVVSLSFSLLLTRKRAGS